MASTDDNIKVNKPDFDCGHSEAFVDACSNFKSYCKKVNKEIGLCKCCSTCRYGCAIDSDTEITEVNISDGTLCGHKASDWENKGEYSVCSICGEMDVNWVSSTLDADYTLTDFEAKKFFEMMERPSPRRVKIRKETLRKATSFFKQTNEGQS